MNFNWDWLHITNDTKESIITIGLGSAIGTLWRAMTRPETVAKRFIVMVITSLSVGTVIGGALIQYFHLSGFVAAGVCSTVALLAEEVLRLIQVRGKKLAQGRIDISLQGDDQ